MARLQIVAPASAKGACYISLLTHLIHRTSRTRSYYG